MGYRSDVGFACSPMVRKIVEQVAEWDSEFKELLEYAQINPDSGDEGRWFWGDVKWYESYGDVYIFESIMTVLDNSEMWDSYGMIRLGEEVDDNVMRGDPSSYDMYVNRSIDI